jgi:murein DD-endopeptidase MepM/ murein hydrolase activator NlpD
MAYLEALERAGLGNTALVSDWMASSQRSLDQPVAVNLPYLEEFYLEPTRGHAIGYRLFGYRGQRIEINIERLDTGSSRLFIDLFREREDEDPKWYPVASADSAELHLQFEIRRDHGYTLRIQPELLRGGRYRISIKAFPALKFPVEGRGDNDIGSFFNDPRDGGTRRHHGVDIFAARHTPVIAPVEAVVRSVRDRGMGGKFIFLSDPTRWIYLYFAHLQEQLVREGQKVYPGDTIGTVGNTGNAKNTPPHLHFGVYYSGIGPVDPIHYIASTDTLPEPIEPGDMIPVEPVRIIEQYRLPYYKRSVGMVDTVLPDNTMMVILGMTANQYRVLLPDGKEGMLPRDIIEDEYQLRTVSGTDSRVAVYESPKPGSAVKTTIKGMDKVKTMGRFNEYQYIETDMGISGWVMISDIANDPG